MINNRKISTEEEFGGETFEFVEIFEDKDQTIDLFMYATYSNEYR